MPQISPPQRRVRLDRRVRREAVFDEAVCLIGEKGFRGFSINELAARCGLTTAGLLHHFKSKDGLLIALLKERDRRDEVAIVDALRPLPQAWLTTGEVRRVLRAIVERNVHQPQLVRLYATLRTEALGQEHPAHDFFRRRDEAIVEMLADLVRPHVADADSTALQIVSLMNGLEVQWLRQNCDFDLAAEWDKAAMKLLT